MLLGAINGKEISDVSIKNLSKGNLDSSVKVAILTMLAGYLGNDQIEVNGSGFINEDYLNNFLSYVLNDKRAAPRNFNLKFSFSDNKQVDFNIKISNYDVLLSFSGGVDSTAGLLHALDQKLKVQPVFISFGQKNEKHELKAVKKLLANLNLKPLIVKIDIDKYMDHDWSRWKLGIIPARNYLFAAIAGSLISKSKGKYGPQIWICAHKEEINPVNTDKSKRFFKSTSKIISSAYGRKIIVCTPFSEITKPEIVSYWHRKWGKKYGVKVGDTVSCYFGNNCGVCKACINRAIAFTCAGVDIENFKVNPFEDKSQIIRDSYIARFKSLKLERKLDFLYALLRNKEVLPSGLGEFVEKEYFKRKNLIKTRIKMIKKVAIK